MRSLEMENAAPDGPRSGDPVCPPAQSTGIDETDLRVSKYHSASSGTSEEGADKPATRGKARRPPEKPGKGDQGESGASIHDDGGSRSSASRAADFMDVPRNLIAALDLARQGLVVFPICDWGDGWKPIKGWQAKASADFATIAGWWTDWPEARVGLPTGKRNGIVALDLDTKNGKDGIAAMAAAGFPDLESLSPSRVRTPSGGLHLLFGDNPDLRNSASKIGDGIDVRAEGGFIVAPGSWKGDRRYLSEGEPVGTVALPTFPDKLAEMAGRRPPVTKVARVGDADDDDDLRAGPQWDKMERAGIALAEGGHLESHDPWFKMVAAIHHASDGTEKGLALADEISQRCSNYDGTELRERWRSFGEYDGPPIRAESLYALANKLVPEWRGRSKAAKQHGASGLRFYTPDQCQSAPRRPYVIKGLLREGNVACIFGPPGVGKSALGPYLGYRVALGEPAFGLRTKPGPVLYVAAEDAHGMMERVTALRSRLGHTSDFIVVDGVTDLLADDSPDLADLQAAVERVRPKLVVIDTLAMAFRDLEENDNQGMTRVVRAARSLTAHDAAVVLIHHGTKADGSTPRGHSSFNGALDTSLELRKHDDDIIRGRLDKNRNGSPDLDIAFRIVPENLGTDEDGDAITAATVEEVAAGSAPRAPRLPVGQREALAILHELEASGQQVTEEEWRDACIESRRVSQSEDRDNRKRAFNRARTGLFHARLILLSDGRVMVARQPDFDWPDDGEDDT